MSKLRISIGALEVEYEGTDDFMKDHLPTLISSLSRLIADTSVDNVADPPERKGAAAGARAKVEGTTATVAAKLGVKTGPDLILAACARLTFGLGKETFTRAEILAEIKTAAAYYTESYNRHLTEHLNSLVKSGRLIERAKDTFSLPAETRKTLESQLA